MLGTKVTTPFCRTPWKLLEKDSRSAVSIGFDPAQQIPPKLTIPLTAVPFTDHQYDTPSNSAGWLRKKLQPSVQLASAFPAKGPPAVVETLNTSHSPFAPVGTWVSEIVSRPLSIDLAV